MVSTCSSRQLKKKLLSERNLTLEKVLSIGKEYEAVLSQVQEMDIKDSRDKNFESEEENVRKIGKYSQRQKFKQNETSNSNKCYNCGDNFVPGHMASCQAKGRKCFNCGRYDHLSKVCRFVNRSENNTQLSATVVES